MEIHEGHKEHEEKAWTFMFLVDRGLRVDWGDSQDATSGWSASGGTWMVESGMHSGQGGCRAGDRARSRALGLAWIASTRPNVSA